MRFRHTEQAYRSSIQMLPLPERLKAFLHEGDQIWAIPENADSDDNLDPDVWSNSAYDSDCSDSDTNNS